MFKWKKDLIKKEKFILDFSNEYVPFLEDVFNTDVKRRWCASYNEYYASEENKWKLSKKIGCFMQRAYSLGLVPQDYVNTYGTIGNNDLYAQTSTSTDFSILSDQQLASVIAKVFTEQ